MARKAPAIYLKRVYEPPAPSDGTRVLVDRVWPRGLSRDKASVDLWVKEVAPSTELRRWFDHDPAKWKEFRRRYRDELRGYGEALSRLVAVVAEGPLTLVFAARDEEHNNAVALKEVLEECLRR